MAADLAVRWRGANNWFDFLELGGMYLFAHLWHHCSHTGAEALPATGPALLIANHASHADPGFLMAGCPRPLHFLQARECYQVPLLCRLFSRAGCIPVTRGRPDKSAIGLALERLAVGQVVALFPEGEVSPVWGGPLRAGKTGAALLALRSRAPVLPVWIEGGPRPRSSLAWLWRAGGMRVVFGSPVDLSAYHGQRISRGLLREVTDLLMSRIAALQPDSSAGKATDALASVGSPVLVMQP
jgi:1-acyl-sn-glycerol-3-phosphate acyltransferase